MKTFVSPPNNLLPWTGYHSDASCLSKVVAVIETKSEGFGELRNTEQGSEVGNKYAQQINVEYVG